MVLLVVGFSSFFQGLGPAEPRAAAVPAEHRPRLTGECGSTLVCAAPLTRADGVTWPASKSISPCRFCCCERCRLWIRRPPAGWHGAALRLTQDSFLSRLAHPLSKSATRYDPHVIVVLTRLLIFIVLTGQLHVMRKGFVHDTAAQPAACPTLADRNRASPLPFSLGFFYCNWPLVAASFCTTDRMTVLSKRSTRKPLL